MWEDVLKTRSHWKLLNSLEQSFVSFCRRVGLLYELTYPYGLDGQDNAYNRNYAEQYEFLYNLLERVLNDMARNGNPVQEKSISQPTPLGAESFRHNVRLTVEDASFYLLFQCIRTEPDEAIIFHTEMNFRVPERFWGNDTKIAEIDRGIADFTSFFIVSSPNFAKSVIENLDIEEVIEEDLHEWWGRVSSEATVMEGTERERWWE